MQQIQFGDTVTTLNPQQYEAVTNTKTNALIVAGAGGGKTRCLISKIAYLFKKYPNIDPKSIVAITFTKKAYQEMRQRLSAILGSDLAGNIYLGTIHSYAFRSMQRHYKVFYQILDDKDAKKQLDTIFDEHYESYLKELYGVTKLASSGQFKISGSELSHLKMDESMVQLRKNLYNIYQFYCDTKYPVSLTKVMSYYRLRSLTKLYQKILDAYQEYKKKHKYLDFADIMHKFTKFLKTPKGMSVKEEVKYLLVDEAQDLNHIQFEIIQQLNERANNCSFYGDDWQAIYRFRGGHVQYMLNFKDYFKPFKQHILEYNYRSTPEIINFCNRLIANNPNQISKNMTPVRSTNFFKPIANKFTYEKAEVNYIIDEIKTTMSSFKYKYEDYAILTRTNFHLEKFELALVKARIPYRRIGGIPLMQRKHIKDIMAYMIVTERSSNFHWNRILMAQPNIGEKTVDKFMKRLKEVDAEKKIGSVVRNPKKYLPEKKDEPIRMKLASLSKWFRELMKIESTDERMKMILEEVRDLTLDIHTDKDDMSLETKFDDLDTLVNTVSQYDSVKQFIHDMHLEIDDLETQNTLVSKQNSDDTSNDGNVLTLSTVHSSKGLEWSTVFVSGVSSINFPLQVSSGFDDAMEEYAEERRLLFVGCSRAKDRLYMTYSENTQASRRANKSKPEPDAKFISPFISEVDTNAYTNLGATKRQIMNTVAKLRTGNLTSIIENYVSVKTPTGLSKYLSMFNVPSVYRQTHNLYTQSFQYPDTIENNRLFKEFGSFLDNLITRYIYQDFYTKISQFPLAQSGRRELPSHVDEYLDRHIPTENCLNSILKLSLCPQAAQLGGGHQDSQSRANNMDPIAITVLSGHFKSQKSATFYTELRRGLSALLSQAQNITLHEVISFADTRAELDFFFDTTLVEIKTSKYEITKLSYVIQSLCYVHLLRRKGRTVERLILFNPVCGTLEEFDLRTWTCDEALFREITGSN